MTHPIPDLLTAESVTEGHPDKVADYVADCLLDAYLDGRGRRMEMWR